MALFESRDRGALSATTANLIITHYYYRTRNIKLLLGIQLEVYKLYAVVWARTIRVRITCN